VYDVSLYGHLTFDRIFDGFKKDTCVGSMGNVWYNLTKINPSLKINLEPTDIGEALILVNREKSERTSIANLNMKSKEPSISESKWNHILYINALSDISFISNIKEGVISADICRGNVLSDLDVLKYIDFLFVSDEDIFMEIDELCKIVKGGIILHNSGGSSFYNKNGFDFKIDVDIIDNVNVLGCGDMLASYFIDSYLKFDDIKKSIKNAHLLVTEYLMEKNK
jgi:hypothetical protein